MARITRFRRATVGTDPVQIVAYQKDRTGVMIRNVGGAEVFISTDQVDIINQGWNIAVGEYVAFLRVDGDAPDLQIYAQTASGTAELRIVESYGEG